MKIFISWSGARSETIASKLRSWLPSVIQAVNPWLSSVDIDPGSRWNVNINKELEETEFGILCVCVDNLYAPWLNFEAGALAKKLDSSNVVPYLIDLEPIDIPAGPLTQFMAIRAHKDDTWKLVQTINSKLEKRIEDDRLSKTFAHWWPSLESSINNLPKSNEVVRRSTRDVLEEMLLLLRGLDRIKGTSWYNIDSIMDKLAEIKRSIDSSSSGDLSLIESSISSIESDVSSIESDISSMRNDKKINSLDSKIKMISDSLEELKRRFYEYVDKA